MAAIPSEPLPPKGVDAGQLSAVLTQAFAAQGLALYEWFSVQEPLWGRGLAQRLVKTQQACTTRESPQ